MFVIIGDIIIYHFTIMVKKPINNERALKNKAINLAIEQIQKQFGKGQL